jgi:YVTN family beta-propeller protein
MAIEIYSTDTDSGSISVVNRADDGNYAPTRQIPVGNAPRGAVKFTKDGRGYVSNCGGDTISEIDAIGHRETARIKVGPAPRGIGVVPGDNFALVSNSGANSVSILDLNARTEVRQLAVGRDPRHMAITAEGHFAYIAIWGSHYVAKVDTHTLAGAQPACHFHTIREVRRIPMPEGSHPYSVAIHPDGKLLFVANTQSHLMAVVDMGRDEIAAEVDLGSRGARAVVFSPDGVHAFVTIENTSEIAVVDTKTLAVVQRIEVGNGPRGLALDLLDMTIYASCFNRGKGGLTGTVVAPDALSVIDLRTALKSNARGAGITSVPVGKGSCSVAVLDLGALRRPASS